MKTASHLSQVIIPDNLKFLCLLSGSFAFSTTGTLLFGFAASLCSFLCLWRFALCVKPFLHFSQKCANSNGANVASVVVISILLPVGSTVIVSI